MTKCTVFTKEKDTSKPIEPVEFKEHFAGNTFVETTGNPEMWNEVILLPKKIRGLDLMLAINYSKGKVIESNLFLGHWNDGVVE